MRILAFFSAILVAAIAFAMEVPASLETLTRDSDRVVRGKVMSISYHKGTNEYGDELIFTDVSIRTDEALKGDRSPLVLRVEGGTFQGVTLAVSDAPEFKVGEDVVVFAKKEVSTFRPTYGGQSKYTVSRDGIIQPKGMRYNEFKKKVLETVQKERR